MLNFFRKSGKPTQEVALVGKNEIYIAGKGYYKDTERLAFNYPEVGQPNISVENVKVYLVPEPNNPFDSTAVRVDVNGYKIGYLEATEAARYFPKLQKLIRSHKKPFTIVPKVRLTPQSNSLKLVYLPDADSI